MPLLVIIDARNAKMRSRQNFVRLGITEARVLLDWLIRGAERKLRNSRIKRTRTITKAGFLVIVVTQRYVISAI